MGHVVATRTHGRRVTTYDNRIHLRYQEMVRMIQYLEGRIINYEGRRCFVSSLLSFAVLSRANKT